MLSPVAPLTEGAKWFERLYTKKAGLQKVIFDPGNSTADYADSADGFLSASSAVKQSERMNTPIPLDLIARGAVNVVPELSVVAPFTEGAKWFERLYKKEAVLQKVILQFGNSTADYTDGADGFPICVICVICG